MSVDMEVHKRDRPMARLFDWFEPAELSKFFEGFRPFEDRIRVEEEMVGDDLVIRAELPGIDPDKDVDITVDDDVMTMTAERRKEETTKTDDEFHSEFRYGSFRRSIRLPRGVKADDVKAVYRDGILEVKVPVPKTDTTAAKVTVSKG